jgi:hypothetical protein
MQYILHAFAARLLLYIHMCMSANMSAGYQCYLASPDCHTTAGLAAASSLALLNKVIAAFA